MTPAPLEIRSLVVEDHPSALDVLGEAFQDYPVMRFVLGPGGDYPGRLRTLVGFFLAARVFRGEPLLGAFHGDHLAGVAIMSLPGDTPPPPALLERRQAVFSALGSAERQRYEAYGEASRTLHIAEPHHHLNMIGVRRAQAGKGIGRRLLDAVTTLAAADPGSAGVSLDTEREDNVRLYEHCGWRVTGHARVGPTLETWAMFRARAPQAPVREAVPQPTFRGWRET